MSSISDIANLALSHVGDDSVVVNILPPNVDNTPAAGHCARFFGVARRTLIELYPWRFATTRFNLAVAGTNPSTAWLYAYVMPSDCVKAVKVLPATGFTIGDMYAPERGGANFDMQAGLIYSDEPGGVLVYRKDILDPTKYTPSFELALSYMLASMIAGPIVKGTEAINMAKGLREVALTIAAQGAALDANVAGEDAAEFTPGSIGAR